MSLCVISQQILQMIELSRIILLLLILLVMHMGYLVMGQIYWGHQTHVTHASWRIELMIVFRWVNDRATNTSALSVAHYSRQRCCVAPMTRTIWAVLLFNVGHFAFDFFEIENKMFEFFILRLSVVLTICGTTTSHVVLLVSKENHGSSLARAAFLFFESRRRNLITVNLTSSRFYWGNL